MLCVEATQKNYKNLDPLAAVIHKNKRNAASNGENVLRPRIKPLICRTSQNSS